MSGIEKSGIKIDMFLWLALDGTVARYYTMVLQTIHVNIIFGRC